MALKKESYDTFENYNKVKYWYFYACLILAEAICEYPELSAKNNNNFFKTVEILSEEEKGGMIYAPHDKK